MTKRIQRRREEEASSGPNWNLIGGGIAVALVALIGLLLFTVTTGGGTAVEPTPVLQENVQDVAGYCEDFPDRCFAIGDPEAPITVVEISDYGCPHCKAFNLETAPTLQQEFVDSGQVRWIVMPYALGDDTHSSAVAALCAADQGPELGYQFHEKMFELQGTADAKTRAGFESVAAAVGLDMTAFEACLDDNTFSSQVHYNRQAARSAGATSTPTFFINGRMMSGNQPLETFRERFTSLAPTSN